MDGRHLSSLSRHTMKNIYQVCYIYTTITPIIAPPCHIYTYIYILTSIVSMMTPKTKRIKPKISPQYDKPKTTTTPPSPAKKKKGRSRRHNKPEAVISKGGSLASDAVMSNLKGYCMHDATNVLKGGSIASSAVMRNIPCSSSQPVFTNAFSVPRPSAVSLGTAAAGISAAAATAAATNMSTAATSPSFMSSMGAKMQEVASGLGFFSGTGGAAAASKRPMSALKKISSPKKSRLVVSPSSSQVKPPKKQQQQNKHSKKKGETDGKAWGAKGGGDGSSPVSCRWNGFSNNNNHIGAPNTQTLQFGQYNLPYGSPAANLGNLSLGCQNMSILSKYDTSTPITPYAQQLVTDNMEGVQPYTMARTTWS